jgi:glycosyltransferase involved in cell wall biosynthesis
MREPVLSVITPSSNYGKYVEDNLESVLTQDFQGVEHVVIDNDSDDETVEILEKYESEYDLRWISEPDRGQVHALNKAIDMATGDWIGWQNIDDYYLPNAFETFDRVRRDNPDADLIYGDAVVVDRNREQLRKRHFTRASRFIHRYHSNFMMNQAAFVRSSFFDDVGPLNENYYYATDVELFWKLLNYDGNYYHVQDYLGAIRMTEGMKSDSPEEQRAESRQIMAGMDRQPVYESYVSDDTLAYLAGGLKRLFRRLE